MLTTREMKINLEAFRHSFAKDLRAFRVNANLSIKEVAEHTRLDELTIYRLEMGYDRDVSLINKLAALYNKRMRLEFY